MEEKKHICKYCGKEFDTGRSLGSHYLHCKNNPKLHEMYMRIGKRKTERSGLKERKLICEYCGKEYILKLSDNSFSKGKYRKCCCSSCSSHLSLKHSDIEQIQKNKSKSLKDHYKDKLKKHFCEYCGKEFTTKDRGTSKYCSEECMKASRHKKLSESAHKNKFGGLNPESTHHFYKRGYYKGIWCDSSWELAYLIYCLDHNINIERNKQFIEYEFQNKIFKFYPDFLVNGELVEIKGFYTPKNLAKREQIHNVKFIDKNLIKPYLKYTIEKYGKSYIDLYDK